MRFLSSFFVLFVMASCASNEETVKDEPKEIESIHQVSTSSKRTIKPIETVVSKTTSIDKQQATKKKNAFVLFEKDIAGVSNPYYDETPINKVITKNVVQIDNGKLSFRTSIIDAGDPRVGCSASSRTISFDLKKEILDNFEMKDSELRLLNFNYVVDGGSIVKEGHNPNIGTIKGQKINGDWNIEIDLKVEMKDSNFPDKEPVLTPLKYKGVFRIL